MVTDMKHEVEIKMVHAETRRRGGIGLLRVSASPREPGKLF
jgi:hypothetical protein